MTHYPRSTFRLAVYAALIGIVFAIDVATPLGLNVPILYLVPLLAVCLLDDVRLRVVFTAIVTALTIAMIPLLWGDTWRLGVINRAFDVAVFVVALALSIRDARMTSELRDLKHAIDVAALVVVTDRNGIVRHVNEQLCEISKYEPQELIGRPWRAVTSESGPASEPWRAAARGDLWHGEIESRDRDGARYWTDTTIVPFRRGAEQPYQYLFISNDVTERKRAEARHRHQAALARIGEMAALVAHEVRNPLAGVRAGLQVLDRSSSLTATERLILTQMVERLDLLNSHVTDLLDFARPRSPNLETVSIKPLLDETARVVLSTGSSGAVDWRIDGPDALVLGDRAMLYEMFTHLLANAGQAVAASGGVVRVTTAREGDSVATTVTDDGPGIPPALHERVFEPFFTTRPGCAGLGLAVVRQLVAIHGGETELAPGQGPGTTVRVRLPSAHAGHGASSLERGPV